MPWATFLRPAGAENPLPATVSVPPCVQQPDLWVKINKRGKVKETAKLLVSCPDQHGLVARISDFVFRNGGNFLHFDQHTDIHAGVFLARAEWELDGFQIPRERISECFQGIALECGMHFELIFSDQVPKIAILVSKLPHCLQDLLLRHQIGEFRAEIALVISNHREAEGIASAFGIPFRHVAYHG